MPKSVPKLFEQWAVEAYVQTSFSHGIAYRSFDVAFCLRASDKKTLSDVPALVNPGFFFLGWLVVDKELAFLFYLDIPNHIYLILII